MTMISKAAVGIAVGIAGIFVGYCIYFDQKRRSDPNFKKNLRERRKAKKEAQSATLKTPDITDHEVLQRFFLREVQLGEEMLTYGDVEAGIQHLGNAVAVCGQPIQLLQVLQKTLPPQIFHLLLQRLQPISQKLSTQIAMADEDVE